MILGLACSATVISGVTTISITNGFPVEYTSTTNDIEFTIKNIFAPLSTKTRVA